jgi:hypothetical protein
MRVNDAAGLLIFGCPYYAASVREAVAAANAALGDSPTSPTKSPSRSKSPSGRDYAVGLGRYRSRHVIGCRLMQ